MKRLLILLLACMASAQAQTSTSGDGGGGGLRGAFAQAPVCSSANKGQQYTVTNATDSTACDGGGTAVNDCYCDGTSYVDTDNASGGGAPTTASYITAVSEGGITGEFALAGLATGILRNTTSTGIPTIATGAQIPAAGSDTQMLFNSSGFLGAVPGFTWDGTLLGFPGARLRIDANGNLEILHSSFQLYGGAALSVTIGSPNHQGTIQLRGGNTAQIAGLDVAVLMRGNSSNAPEVVAGIQAPVATARGFLVQGAAGQTANLFEFRDGAASFLTGFDSLGNFSGQANTAAELAADPDPCPAGDFVEDIDADGTLVCDTPAGGPGGGASEISDLTDLQVSRDADTGILNVAAGRARFGNFTYTIGAATIELDDASGTGDAEIYVAQNGVLTIAHDSLTVSCTGCSETGTGAGIPVTAIPLAAWTTASAGVWDATGTERRALGRDSVQPGGALAASDVSGVRTIAVDIANQTNEASPADGDNFLFQQVSDGAFRRITTAQLAAILGVPAGSGNELQYRVDASTFGAVPGSGYASNALTLLSADTNPTALITNTTGTVTGSWTAHGSGFVRIGAETNHALRLFSNDEPGIVLTAAGLPQFWDRADATKIWSFDPSNLPTETTVTSNAPTADGVLFSLGMTLDISANTNLGGTGPIALSGDDVTCPTCEVTGNKDQNDGYLGIDANGDAVIPRHLTVNGNLTVGDGTAPGQIALPELAVNGTDHRTWKVPDALTAPLVMEFANAIPTAAGTVPLFSDGSGGTSTITWGLLGSIGGQIGDAQIADGAVDGGTGGEITDGSITSADLAAANKTVTMSWAISDPATADSHNIQWLAPANVTITAINCSTDTGTADIELEERALTTPNTAGTAVMGADLQCDNDNAQDTSFSNAGIASGALLSLEVAAVASTPGQLRVHVTYTVD